MRNQRLFRITNQRLFKMSDNALNSTKPSPAAGVMIYVKCYVDIWYFNNKRVATAGS